MMTIHRQVVESQGHAHHHLDQNISNNQLIGRKVEIYKIQIVLCKSGTSVALAHKETIFCVQQLTLPDLNVNSELFQISSNQFLHKVEQIWPVTSGKNPCGSILMKDWFRGGLKSVSGERESMCVTYHFTASSILNNKVRHSLFLNKLVRSRHPLFYSSSS